MWLKDIWPSDPVMILSDLPTSVAFPRVSWQFPQYALRKFSGRPCLNEARHLSKLAYWGVAAFWILWLSLEHCIGLQ